MSATSSHHALARIIVRRRAWIAATWCVLALLLVPIAADINHKLRVSAADVDGSESVLVDKLLVSRFGSQFAGQAVLVVEHSPLVVEGPGRALLGDLSTMLRQISSVTRVVSYLDVPDAAFVNVSGTFLLVGLESGAQDADAIMVTLRAATSQFQERVRARYPDIRLSWTGAAAIDQDVRFTSAHDASRAERSVLPLTLLLLVIVFRGFLAAIVPIGIGGLAIAVSLGAAALISAQMPLVILLQNVVSMLGLGLGVDYALLIVSRFREALSVGRDAEAAAIEAAQHAGHTVMVSGSAVVIGFLALLLIPATELRSVAMGGVLIVSASVLLAATLLPGILAWLGTRIDFGRLRPTCRLFGEKQPWRQWGQWVSLHPGSALLAGGVILLALGWQAHRANTDIPSANWLPLNMESTVGAEALRRMGHSGVVQTMRVLVEFPSTVDATGDVAWNAVDKLSRIFEADARIAAVRSPPAFLGKQRPAGMSLMSMLPADVISAYVARDKRMALIELVPQESETPGQLARYVRELRQLNVAAVTGLEQTHILIGGLPAANADYQDAVGSRALGVVGVVVVATLLALAISFRSLLIACKAVLLNLVSVGASLGAAVLVFQDGYGAQWLGLAAPIDGLFPAVPIIVFCIVFGLSMDYEVFLIARIAESMRKGLTDREALVEGIALSGGIITSAALVMIVVFAGFALGDFLIVKILGFTLATAVLLDATLVRMVVGPALFRFAGRWNWWPGIR